MLFFAFGENQGRSAEATGSGPGDAPSSGRRFVSRQARMTSLVQPLVEPSCHKYAHTYTLLHALSAEDQDALLQTGGTSSCIGDHIMQMVAALHSRDSYSDNIMTALKLVPHDQSHISIASPLPFPLEHLIGHRAVPVVV